MLLRPSAATPKPLHNVVHHIDTGSAAPCFARPRQLDPEKHHVAYAEFITLGKTGIFHHSNSPWASAFYLVPRKDGSWHPAVTTVPDRYPLPNIQSLNDRMSCCPVFSKIDLVKAYHQIPNSEVKIPKTGNCHPFLPF
jgi:hypothetical protein